MKPYPIELPHKMTLLHLSEQNFRTDRLTGVFALPLRQEIGACPPAMAAPQGLACCLWPVLLVGLLMNLRIWGVSG